MTETLLGSTESMPVTPEPVPMLPGVAEWEALHGERLTAETWKARMAEVQEQIRVMGLDLEQLLPGGV